MYRLTRKKRGATDEIVAYVEELQEIPGKLMALGFGKAKRQMVAGHICYRNQSDMLVLEYGKNL